jgi:Spy/CpxP family protein refolding chaperone
MMVKTLTATLAAIAMSGTIAVVHAQTRGPGPGRSFGPDFGPDGHRLAELLGLSEEQQSQLKAMREKDREANKPLLEAARQAHQTFRDALEAESPDPTAVGEAALAMHAAEKKLGDARKAAFERMKSILTPDQIAKLEQMRPMGGRPPGPPDGDQP